MSGTQAHQFPALIRLDQFDFHSRLAEVPGPALIMFAAPACGGCRHLRVVLQAVSRQRPEWTVFEVDAHCDAALTTEFDVFHLPSMFLFNRGDYHSDLQAEANVAAIIAAVDAALLRPAEEAP